MPTFTLEVREAGRRLGETQVNIPELTFVPETAATHVRADGGETALLGWAGRLWAVMHEPSLGGERGAPMSPEGFARLANAASGGNSFEAAGPRSPFEPDRFLRPLEIRKGAPQGEVFDARLSEVRKISEGFALIDGLVHRAVSEPVHVVSAGQGGIRLNIRFRDDAGDMPSISWSVFRADRRCNAEVFAALLAERHGVPVLEPTGWLRVVYSQILRVDDVGEAFAEVFRRYRAGRFDAPGPMESRIAALPRDLTDPGAAEEAYDILGGIRSETASAGTGMRSEATREVCELVAMRYENVDRDWLVARATPPVFAP